MDTKALITANRRLLAERWKLRRLNPKMFKSGDIAPPPPKGFIRGYHFLKVNNGIDDIKKGQLKVSRYSDVNDPFELLALNFHEPSVRQVARKHKTDQDINTGLLCFSKNWKHPLLWSHYAEKHRGLALGFDLRASRVEAVTYEDERIRAELHAHDGDPLKIPPDVQKLLRVTKARCWDYEEEVRLFVSLGKAKWDGKFHFWQFDDDLRLVEVIIGPECTKCVSTIEALAEPHVYVSKARLAWRSFSVTPNGNQLSSNLRAEL